MLVLASASAGLPSHKSHTVAAFLNDFTAQLIAADDLDVTCAGAMKITDPSEVSWYSHASGALQCPSQSCCQSRSACWTDPGRDDRERAPRLRPAWRADHAEHVFAWKVHDLIT